MPTFDVSSWIAASPETVFDLSRSIDAHTASMAGSGERVVGGVTAGHIDLGQEVTWRARHFGVTFEMTARIVELDRPTRFVDEQVKGPFEAWRHLHEFVSEGEGARMLDRIHYEVPFGLLGRTIDRLLLNDYLVRLISERNDFIKDAAETV